MQQVGKGSLCLCRISLPLNEVLPTRHHVPCKDTGTHAVFILSVLFFFGLSKCHGTHLTCLCGWFVCGAIRHLWDALSGSCSDHMRRAMPSLLAYLVCVIQLKTGRSLCANSRNMKRNEISRIRHHTGRRM